MTEREYFRNRHPPACTCVDCSRRRIARQRQQGLLARLLNLFRRRERR